MSKFTGDVDNMLNDSKDVYEYLTKFGDDKDILTMLKTNKMVDDNFFKRVLQRKYPGLIILKETKYKDETWRLFYINMIYYLSKIKEKYNISYINSKHFDPKELYEFHDMKKILTELLSYAADIGDKQLIDKFIKEGADLYSAGVLFYPIQNKDKKTLEYLLKEKGSILYADLWYDVGKTEDLDFINFLIKNEEIDEVGFDALINGVASNLNKNLLTYLLKERNVKFSEYDPFDAAAEIRDQIRWNKNDGKNPKRMEIYKILTENDYIQ